MDARVEFQAEGVKRALEEAGRQAEDLTPLMDKIGTRLRESARIRIRESNTSPDGVPWPKSFRVISGQGGKTLLDSGRLDESLTFRAGPREVAIGTHIHYAAIHQFGGEIVPKAAGALFFKLANGATVMAGKVTIPARPYLGISAEDETAIGDLVELQLTGAFDDVV